MKAFFLSRLFREKILLVVLALGLALVWLSSSVRRTSAFVRSAQATSSELEAQRLAIEAKPSIDARASAALQQLDPGKTLDNVALSTELDTIARGAGLNRNMTIGDPKSEPAGQFKIHTVNVTFHNAEYKALVDFYERLTQRAPYIGIERFNVNSGGANPAQLTASIVVSSVEVLR